MKHRFPRRREQRGSIISSTRVELIPELIARHGLHMLDNVYRCRNIWTPHCIR